MRTSPDPVGEPSLLVVGVYRMGFELEAAGGGAATTLRIGNQLPLRGVARCLGLMLGRTHARRFVRTMVRDAQRALQP